MTAEIPPQLRKLVDQAAKAEKDGQKAVEHLLEKADSVRTFTHKGLTLHFRKLPLPDALRIQGKMPKCVIADAGEESQDIDLTPEETWQYLDAITEALAISNVDGYSKEQFGRMTPPEYPEDFLGAAYHFVLRMNMMTKKQLDDVGFFRGQP